MSCGVPDFRQTEVLVVGDVMLDRYWSGPTQRISPEAPVPVVKVAEITERPGGAANVAMNIAALGGDATLVGLTGKDEAAQLLADKLQQHNVTCDFEQSPQQPTITKLRILSRNQQLLRLDFEEPFHTQIQHTLVQRVAKHLANKKAIIFSDYAKGALDEIGQMIALAKQYQLPILIDPKGNDFARYRGASILTPNLSEFEAVVGVCQSEEELVKRGTELLYRFDFEALLITRSEHGMTLLQRDVAPYHLATHAQEVFDVTGAGDTVIATLASGLAAGLELEEACYLANVAAGVVIGKLGTSVLTPIELENAIRGRANNGFGIIEKASLQLAIQAARQRGERIVMTNGCFDILHAGHVSYLANARKLGERLIVAVNSDASTRRLKGETRPVNPLQQRMIVLSALESVDWVIPFEEDTPQQLIAELLPDLLVKGGDYKVSEIAGATEVINAGGAVKVLNFEDGCSTSAIIEKIKR